MYDKNKKYKIKTNDGLISTGNIIEEDLYMIKIITLFIARSILLRFILLKIFNTNLGINFFNKVFISLFPGDEQILTKR